ncbi:MAG TPA: ATP-binding cassette domain-containing protein [Acidobacteriota bacterium]|nr:ATP-binding cassette domain-containing protein [Acidobacteriota bacterium]
MIEVQRLTKTFQLSRRQRRELGKDQSTKTLTAVDDVSFECRPGRIFTLLGPNGAGKTTALRIMATLMKPSSGTVTVNGNDVRKSPSQVRASMGFLTGSTGLYARLTPLEILKYYADLYELPSAEFEKRRDELIDRLGIESFTHQRIGKLSTGQKQRVSIARTMIHDPEVVVFDEPTAGLDVISARNIVQLIKDCRGRGKTVIFSTHIMGEVSLLADDLAIIHKGRLLFNGPFKSFRERMESRSLEDEFIRIVEAA